jgi:DNA-binding transcriptional regulator YbjK
MPPASRSSAASEITAAARGLVAEEGLRGLSLRKVASRAGVSLGGVSYQMGGKADLVRQLIGEAVAERRERHSHWLARARRLDLGDPAVRATLVGAYLDDAALSHREHSLAVCELILEAGRDPAADNGMRALIADEESFWRAALAGQPQAGDLGEAIADYCRDELPFALAIGLDPDYRLLRASVCARLTDRLRDVGDHGFAAGFEALVAAMDARAIDIRKPLAADPDSRRARIAAAVAELIGEDGVASVTHRAVAAAVGAPNSTVAHYFRTRDDLLRAGIEALYLGATGSASAAPDSAARRGGLSLMRATRALVLSAARDASLRPFALDLRRRRGEHMGDLVAPIGGAQPLDAAAAQAAAMVLSGAGVARQALGEGPGATSLAERLAGLRAAATA